MSSALTVVVFSHDSMLFGLEAHRVAGRGLVNHQSASVIPFSKLYFTHNDGATAVNQTLTQCLRLRGNKADWLLGLNDSNDSIDLIELPSSRIYPLPALLASCVEFAPLKAIGFYQQQLVALLDVDLLTQLATQ